MQADVSQAADVEALISTTVETYGRLDCAHNNAGIAGKAQSTIDCTEENWERIIAINLTGGLAVHEGGDSAHAHPG